MNDLFFGLGLVLLTVLSTGLAWLFRRILTHHHPPVLDGKTKRMRAISAQEFPMLTTDTHSYLRSVKTWSQHGLKDSI